ncbi:aspartate carbamoyltransferase [Iodidimonas gelatinilytica]|uniref:Aspartate carbamoyltransferase n=1 Tax=Iodidimonas gelatinilytica TaxID=1236966 RepID=A0A5A7MQF3_9PROT|nr:aspartate carbamoyltransferase catalytic subunit [Iodidimonas gelatinilytica]GEQ98320.1 aspartate carbamoyltransferase [Iodidimonas gelatinilytica]
MTHEPKPEREPYLRAMIDPPGGDPFPHRHLLGIEGLAPEQIQYLLDIAQGYADAQRKRQHQHTPLRGLTQINLFFESSTRTLMSFEIAGKRLGMDTVSFSVGASSIKKGETLLDTAQTLNAMRPDVLVVRHAQSGAVSLLSQKVNCAVINAGDGRHEHPTQALLDALTIRRRKGRIHGLTIAICGDITHSRVARSNIHLLNAMGARVRVVAPPTLIPQACERLGVEVHNQMSEGLHDCDVVMMLRLQKERMQGAFVPSEREFFHFYGLTKTKLKVAKPDVLVMHPGPMNRGVEIATSVADDLQHSAIEEQVEMGVAVRMGCMDVLTRHLRGGCDEGDAR